MPIMIGPDKKLDDKNIEIIYETLHLYTVSYPRFVVDERTCMPNFQVVFQNFNKPKLEDGNEGVTNKDMIQNFYEIMAQTINTKMVLSNY